MNLKSRIPFKRQYINNYVELNKRVLFKLNFYDLRLTTFIVRLAYDNRPKLFNCMRFR